METNNNSFEECVICYSYYILGEFNCSHKCCIKCIDKLVSNTLDPKCHMCRTKITSIKCKKYLNPYNYINSILPNKMYIVNNICTEFTLDNKQIHIFGTSFKILICKHKLLDRIYVFIYMPNNNYIKSGICMLKHDKDNMYHCNINDMISEIDVYNNNNDSMLPFLDINENNILFCDYSKNCYILTDVNLNIIEKYYLVNMNNDNIYGYISTATCMLNGCAVPLYACFTNNVFIYCFYIEDEMPNILISDVNINSKSDNFKVIGYNLIENNKITQNILNGIKIYTDYESSYDIKNIIKITVNNETLLPYFINIHSFIYNKSKPNLSSYPIIRKCNITNSDNKTIITSCPWFICSLMYGCDNENLYYKANIKDKKNFKVKVKYMCNCVEYINIIYVNKNIINKTFVNNTVIIDSAYSGKGINNIYLLEKCIQIFDPKRKIDIKYMNNKNNYELLVINASDIYNLYG
jgi:hypothetical protein